MMANAELTGLRLKRFKSYDQAVDIELKPLTILLGRNNCGKSSIIQALLLLSQTLNQRRADVPLHLEGNVDALNLRELTYGWPEDLSQEGPEIEVRWTSTVSRWIKNWDSLLVEAGVDWPPTIEQATLETCLRIQLCEFNGGMQVREIILTSRRISEPPVENPRASFRPGSEIGEYDFFWNGQKASGIEFRLDHFIPRHEFWVGTRLSEPDSWLTAFEAIYARPLEILRWLLGRFRYLSSVRSLPPAIYKIPSVPPDDIGISGEYAAQMLHKRRLDLVHYLPPLTVDGDEISVPRSVLRQSLLEAINAVFADLGVNAADLEIEDIRDLGFRLLFGKASFQHVGRGLGYLLPVVQLGLIADPLRSEYPADARKGGLSPEAFEELFELPAHIAIEEPETHLHPKVQTRLAHWFVALAMAGRRMILETHSDHLVRRLRGLIARAEKGSPLETWLEENVAVIEVEQDADGRSTATQSRLTDLGDIEERWPADFMDESADEERAIYYAALDKKPEEPVYDDQTVVVHESTE